MNAGELKIVFAGPMGAGKTTAIRALSDIEPVSTEVGNTDLASHSKQLTTVALDYGHLQLDDGNVVKLYGTPGQSRFAFMWDILCAGAIGIVLLVDASRDDALDDFRAFVDTLRRIARDQPLIVGVGRPTSADGSHLAPFQAHLASQGIVAPVFGVDARERADVLLLVETLLCVLEARVEEKTRAVN
ncbi:MAG TPA: ATP/GTP-binding protein [Steroidobacteraceae bacterium]|nr:ATP/GTP-binding protein [Steroidobacteraceae bacterium]